MPGIDQATGNVYVGQFLDDRVQYFTSTGAFLGKWGSSATFDSPGALAIDPSTNSVFVAEYDGARVQQFGPGGAFSKKHYKEGGRAILQPARRRGRG